MKHLILLVLSFIPSLALAQEAPKKLELPPAVTATADMRIEITIKWQGETYRVLVPAKSSERGIATLRASLRNAGIPFADKKTTDKAVADGGKHAVLSLLGGDYVLVPVK